MVAYRLLFTCLIIPVLHLGANPSCPKLKSGMTNVHLVCHTHDDVGWLKTVEQYYYGARKNITWVGVQYILDSVVRALARDPARKFIYVESAFFFRWWNEQNDPTKNLVKKLVSNGQLEFTGGGWSMNDEAAAHYNAIIDQMTLGLSMLNDTFGEGAFPRIAWQIDPFGHSREQASLFAQMGMDGLFFGRLDHADKSRRWDTKTMEMIWKGSDSLGKESWLFTGVLPRTYSPPKGFCFDLLCADDPIMDDPRLEEYNADEMVNRFIKTVSDQKSGYATSNLIMTMGEDFDYVYAESWYKNLDKLIKYVNGRQLNGSKVNVVYSTPSCYLDALHQSRTKWTSKTDDFFPYSSDPHAYWTGYFTSRPTFKGYVRMANNILQATKQISALVGMDPGDHIMKLQKAMGVAQHHDAITGTAKQHVSDDYTKRLTDGITAANSALREGLTKLTSGSQLFPETNNYEFCPLLNISSCPFIERNEQSFIVTVYNPLGHTRGSYVRVPVQYSTSYKVTNDRGRAVVAQLVPLPAAVLDIPGRKSNALFDLVFYAEDLPPLGIVQFHVQRSENEQLALEQKSMKLPLNPYRNTSLKKGSLYVTLDRTSHLLISVGLMDPGVGKKDVKVTQDWFWYEGMAGNNSDFDLRASGAYIFRPAEPAEKFTSVVNITAIYEGALVTEVHQQWESWVTQIIRLYKHKRHVEFEWIVGPIPVEDGIGKEIVTRCYFPEMDTQSTFFTDANGRQLMKRIRNYRPTWKLSSSEPISQNYYPVTSRMVLSSVNGKGKAAVLNDRAQGGTSLRSGEMEFMVHRRLLYDDAFGVGEPLNETAFGEGLVARGKFYLLHSLFGDDGCDFACQHRSLAQELLFQPLAFFSSSPKDVHEWREKTNTKFSGLSVPLPSNIHLLTLEPWKDRHWLLRLEHFYEKNESVLSKDVTVDIKNLVKNWRVKSIRELTLGANRFKEDSIRLQWGSDSNEADALNDKDKSIDGVYTFSPMQIRTFLLEVSNVSQEDKN